MGRSFRNRILAIPAAMLVILMTAFFGGAVYAEGFTPPDNGLPVVYLNIDEERGTIDAMNSDRNHSTYCYGTLSIDAPENFKYSDMTTSFGDIGDISMSIRGRGNSTWSRYPKLPYKIKLDSKVDLLQRGDSYKNKHWVLVANYSDETLLKDRMTAYLADEMDFEFTPRGVPVDLVMKGTDPSGEYYEGKYLGSYYLSENVRVDKNRLPIEELEETDTELTKITGGYLLQEPSQVRAGSPDKFETKRYVGWATHTPSFDTEADGHALTGQLGNANGGGDPDDIFNDPDPKEESEGGTLIGDAYENNKQQQYIQEHMQMVEDALYADGTGYRDLMDTESAAKYWLVNTFANNHDAYATGSTYIYKHRDVNGVVGKMYWGPIWDYDYAWYYADDPFNVSFSIRHTWLEPMFYDKATGGFVPEVKKQWEKMKPILHNIERDGGILDQYCEETKASAMVDRRLWHGDADADAFDYEGNLEAFKTWIRLRMGWIDENIDSIDGMVHKVRFVSDGETWINYFPQHDWPMGVEPDEPVKKGYVFIGWTDENGDPFDRTAAVTEDKTYTANFVAEDKATKAQDIAFPKASDVVHRHPYVSGYDIEYAVLPSDAQDKRVEWTSSDEDFATIDNEGHITFMDKGEGDIVATFTARLSSGVTRGFKLLLTSEQPPVPQAISPEKDIIEMGVGEQAPFTIKTEPEFAKIYYYYYASDDESVVKVDDEGVLTAIAPGETTVRVLVGTNEGELETTVTVKVSDKSGPTPKPTPAPETKPSGTLLAKMTAKGNSSLVISWTKVSNVDGYDVFFSKCGEDNKIKLAKTIKGNKTFKWTKRSLKKKIGYKAIVKAWVKKNGKKTYVKASPRVHAYTSGGTKKFTNPKKVTVKKTSVSLKAGKTYKIKASVTKLQNGKKLMPKGHDPELRYLSSNKKIATVTKVGKIKAVSKGSCKVYVIATNGVRKTVKVTVK